MIAIGNSGVFCVLLTYISQLRAICQEKGLSVSQTADIISAFSCVEMVSRFSQGFLSDRPFIVNTFRHPKKSLYTLMSFGVAACLFAMTFAYNFITMTVCVCTCSLFGASILVNNPLIYNECFNEDLPSALGLSNLIRGLMAMVLGIISGILNTQYGSVNYSFYFLAAVIIVCMGFWTIYDVISKYRRRRDL